MLHLTNHAIDRITTRFIDYQNEIVHKLESAKIPYSNNEVRVVVKAFSSRVKLSDGTQGDFIVACVTQGRVKTIMLQRSLQIEKQAKIIKYFDLTR